MIKAVKDGVVSEFSERSWELIKASRRGWQEIKDIAPENRIPVEEVKLEKVPTEKVQEEVELHGVLKSPLVVEPKVVKQVPTEQILILTVDEMKANLKDLGVKFHHKLGDEKIKELYDENTK